MIRIALLASAALALTACSGESGKSAEPAAPAAATTPAASPEAAFVTAVAQSDLYEVKASRMARSRSANMDIKLYAQKMMDVHTATTAEMSGLLTGAPDAVIPVNSDAKHAALLAELRAASTADFEALYLKQQVAAHRDALAVLETYAATGANAELKAFAAKTAPTVKAHLDAATKLAG